MRSKNSPDGQSFLEAARRAQIVACAIETLAVEGYANASLARIAERAGVSKSVIVYHFGGKDEVLESVVQEVFEAATGA
ncbi:MAG TPA: TetR/AcrR family transcriptional regulator, partial [Candidatus Binatia bacterium]|nr:TetR/AcrR family transcriptional regulator [Candidatus Binatia bacterium]